jgi:hypothetical protein
MCSSAKMFVLCDVDVLRHYSSNSTEELVCVLHCGTGKSKAVLALKVSVALFQTLKLMWHFPDVEVCVALFQALKFM